MIYTSGSIALVIQEETWKFIELQRDYILIILESRLILTIIP
jgi:hypothetical protein